jgi:hypothetical protein
MGNTIQYICIYFFIWSSTLSLGLALFRYKWTANVKPMFLSVIPLTVISVLLQVFDKAYLTAIVQPVCITLCYVFIFKIYWRNSLLIVAHSYCICIFSEFLLNYIFTFFDLKQVMLNLQGNDLPIVGYMMSFINVFLCVILYSLRWGFTVIPSSKKLHLPLINLNKQIVTVILSSFFFAGLSSLTIFFINYLTVWVESIILLIWLFLLKLVYQRVQMD